MNDDRAPGDLTCKQVLERLGDYLDDDLAADERARVDEHLRGCDRCLRFGGAIGAMVRALRAGDDDDDDVPAASAARLAARLDDAR